MVDTGYMGKAAYTGPTMHITGDDGEVSTLLPGFAVEIYGWSGMETAMIKSPVKRGLYTTTDRTHLEEIE